MQIIRLSFIIAAASLIEAYRCMSFAKHFWVCKQNHLYELFDDYKHRLGFFTVPTYSYRISACGELQ